MFLEDILLRSSEESEPTALAAGLEVGRFDLQTVWPMLMFLGSLCTKIGLFYRLDCNFETRG